MLTATYSIGGLLVLALMTGAALLLAGLRDVFHEPRHDVAQALHGANVAPDVSPFPVESRRAFTR